MGFGVVAVTKHTELTDKEVAGVIDHAGASITTAKLVDAILTADAAGRAKMADDFITNAKILAGTIDLTTKGTYVPVNKAGDTMPGDLTLQGGAVFRPSNWSYLTIRTSNVTADRQIISGYGDAYDKLQLDSFGSVIPRVDKQVAIGESGRRFASAAFWGDIACDGKVDGVDVGSHDHSTGAGMGVAIARAESESGDFGGNFAAYTPPTGYEGRIRVVADTNVTTPARRLYAYVAAAWRYVALS